MSPVQIAALAGLSLGIATFVVFLWAIHRGTRPESGVIEIDPTGIAIAFGLWAAMAGLLWFGVLGLIASLVAR